MLAWVACLAWQLAGLPVDAAAIKVLLIQNTLLSNDFWEGLELSRAQLGTNATHSLKVKLCAEALDHLDRVKTCNLERGWVSKLRALERLARYRHGRE